MPPPSTVSFTQKSEDLGRAEEINPLKKQEKDPELEVASDQALEIWIWHVSVDAFYW